VSGSQKPARRYELDWLRSFAVLGLIPFHAAIIFTTGSRDYVKNEQTSYMMDMLTSFITFWGIPLIFLVSGAAARYALLVRTPARYMYERVTRLVIPFLFAMVSVVPLQVYIGHLSDPGPREPFLSFYAGFIQSLLAIFTGVLPERGPEWIGHLWFIPPLMLFAFAAVPLSRLLATDRGKRFLAALANLGGGFGLLLLFGLVPGLLLLITQLGLAEISWLPDQITGSAIGFIQYLVYFLYGYILYADSRFLTTLRRHAWNSLMLGLAAWVTYLVVTRTGHAPESALTPRYALFTLIRGYISWWWVIGILGFGIRYLGFTTKGLRYVSTATYPVYIIHMPILSFLAYLIVQTEVGIWLKFALITCATLAVSLLVYELIISRVPVLRVLFGLHPKGTRAPGGTGTTRTAVTPGTEMPTGQSKTLPSAPSGTSSVPRVPHPL
jgi:peptidoglycan/LPS O-acetylase OafA/YrhL